MKRLKKMMIALIAVFGINASLAADNAVANIDTTWYDETRTTFTLTTENQFAGFAQLVNAGTSFANKTVTLGADLTFGEDEVRSSAMFSKAFDGIFDGNGKTIKGLKFNGSGSYLCLFYGLKDGGIIRNLILDTVTLSGSINWTGGLVGLVSGGATVTGVTVKNLTVTPDSVFKNFGGIASYVYAGATISNCLVDGLTVTGVGGNTIIASSNGGIAGQTVANLTDCTVKNMNITMYEVTQTGGIVGCIRGAVTIDNCDVTGFTLNCTNHGGDTMTHNGGVVGIANEGASTIKNCEAKTVSMTSGGNVGCIGGIVGVDKGAAVTVESCSVDGFTVHGTNDYNHHIGNTMVGGVVGYSNSGYVTIKDTHVANVTYTSDPGVYVAAAEYIGMIEEAAVKNAVIHKDCTASNVTGANRTLLGYDHKNYYMDDSGETYVVKSAVAWTVVDGKETGFGSLKEAVNNADAGATVTLLADMQLAEMLIIAEDKNITLDLNGKAVSVTKSGDRSLYAFENLGTLTLTDSVGTGSITARGNYNRGTMVMDGGTIVACDTNGGYGVWNYGNFTMNGGMIKVTHVGAYSDQYGPTGFGNMSGATALITGGRFEGVNARAYVISSEGDLTITPAEGKTVTVYAPRAVAIDAGVATINGGTFETFDARNSGENGAHVAAEIYYPLYVSGGKVTVTGGEFEAPVVAGEPSHSLMINGAEAEVVLNGGTYNQPARIDDTTSPNLTKADTVELGTPAGFTWEDGKLVAFKPAGSIAQAIVNSNKPEIMGGTWVTIYSEATICAQRSMVVKLYSGETLLGTTELVDTEKVLLNGTSNNVTYHFFLDGQDDWWKTTWEAEPLLANVVPDKVELWCDGVKVAENTVYLSNSNDNMGDSTVLYNWGDLKGVKVAKIDVAGENGETETNYYDTLQEAIDAAPAGQTVTLLGTVKIAAEDGKPETHAWVKADKNVVIDLNQNTVDGAFFVNGRATIKNGSIVNSSMVSGIETQGDLTLENMTITSDRHGVRVSGGTTTILSGTYQTVGTSGSRHTINASGGNTVLDIKGGTFYGAGYANLGGNGNCVMDQGCKAVTISGGEFYGANGVEGPVCAASNTLISGGTFEDTTTTFRYTSQLAEGRIVVKDGNLYEVIEFTNWAQVADTSWYNETDSEFTLTTAEQLAGLAKLVNEGNTFSGKTIKLGADIDLKNVEWTPIGGTNPFLGTFDGQEHTVSNLFIETTDNNVGLFGNAWHAIEIKNLSIHNANVTGGSQSVAVLVGNASVKLTNCHISGQIAVTGGLKYIGGIAGYYYGTMSGCSIKGTVEQHGTVTAGNFAGALAGFVGEDSTVSGNEVAYVDVRATGGGFGFGLLAGNANYGLKAQDNVFQSATVTTSDPYGISASVVGQIAGADRLSTVVNNTVSDCAVTDKNGTVTGQVGQGGNVANTVVGTGVTFDDAGKVTGGTFEVAPPENAVADGFAVVEGTNGGFGVAQKPDLSCAYISWLEKDLRIWGEVTGLNGVSSFVVNFYTADGEKIASTTLKQAIPGTGSLSWHLRIAGSCDDEWWSYEWADGNPSPDKAPVKAEFVINGRNWGDIDISYKHEVFPCRENWADYFVVSMNDVYYFSLQEAVDAAEAGAEIFVLSETTEEMVTIAAGKDVDIDFGGQTLNGSMLVEKGATADVKGGSILQVKTIAGIEVQGVATLTDMNITSDRHAIRVDGLNTEGTSLVIDGGTYQANAPTGWTAHAINAGEGSTVVIKDGTFIGAGVANKGGNGNCVMVKDAATTVTIEGGTFYGANGPEGVVCAADKLTISGGAFGTWSYDNYLAEGKCVDLNGEMYEVVDAIVKNVTSGKIYGSLQAAFDAADAGDVVTLLADITINAVDGEPATHAWVKEGQDVVVDLNEKTVTGAFFVSGKATIKNGSIVNNSYVSAIETQGDLTLDAVALTSDRHALRVSGGAVTILGGSYTSVAKSATHHGVNISGGAQVTILGGAFVGCGQSGGCAAVAMRGDGTTLTITGGEFSNDGGSHTVAAWGGVLNISGGVFHKAAEDTLNMGGTDKGTSETGITGGIFEDKPDTGLLQQGKAAFAVAAGEHEGWYEITDAVAKVGDEPYATIQAAIDAVPADVATTITLLADITLEEGVYVGLDEYGNLINQIVTLDMNGKAITYTGEFFAVENYATLTITGNGKVLAENGVALYNGEGLKKLTVVNGEFVSGAGEAALQNEFGGVADVQGGTFTGNGNGIMNGAGCVLTVTGGTITGLEHAGIANYGGEVDISGETTTVVGNSAVDALVNDTQEVEGTIAVSGGTYSSDVSKYAVDGFYAAYNPETGMYGMAQVTNWIQVADTTWHNENGTEFTLSTAQQLAGLAKLVNDGTSFAGVTIKLGGDLDLSAYVWPGIGVYNETGVGTAFQGTFDGANHTISGMTFANNATGNKYRGFFNQIYYATVKNVTIESKGFESTVSGSYGGAAIVGHAFSSTIENCVSTGALTGTHNVAGIVVRVSSDENREVVVSGCINKARLENNYSKLAGIVNIAQNIKTPCRITNCVNEGEIVSTAGGANGVGGILGWNGYASSFTPAAAAPVVIANCENKGVIIGTETAKVGQIIGSAEAYLTIENGNKGLATQLAIGDNPNYLNFATVADGVATYVTRLRADETYLVTAKDAKPSVKLAAGSSIVFDQSIAKIGDETGITAANGAIVKTEEDSRVTFKAVVAQIVGADEAVDYGTLQEAIDAAMAAGGGTVKLLGDTDESVIIAKSAKTRAAQTAMTLDLNGSTVAQVTVPATASLMLDDSSAEKDGSITELVMLSGASLVKTDDVAEENIGKPEGYTWNGNVLEANKQKVNVDITPVGSGTVTGIPTGDVDYGTTFTLTAIANAGYVFAGWTGDFTELAAEIEVEVAGNVNLTATFVPETLYASMTNSVIVTYKKDNELISIHEIQNMSVQNPTIEVKDGLATVGIQLMDATTLKGANGKPDWNVVPLEDLTTTVEGDTIKVKLPAEGNMRFFRFVPVNGLD